MDSNHATLAMLDGFVSRALPTILRRMRCWKGLNTRQHIDVIEDLRQDLVLDCLEHADAISSMTQAERHSRWFRLLERRHYELRVRAGRRCDAGSSPEQLGRSPEGPLMLEETLSANDQQTLRRLSAAATTLKNGRLNSEATAATLGVQPREVRAAWARVAAALGYDDRYLAFWRRRLVEALIGLAADDLRDRGLVRVFNDPPRSRPDPIGRLRRIRRIKRQLSVRPLPPDLKSVLAEFTRRGVSDQPNCQRALHAARRLNPNCPAVHLWQFECSVAHRSLPQAARALRRARASGGDAVRLILARARLLEASGHHHKAERVLRRSATRHRGDARLTAALPALRASGVPHSR